MKKPDFMIICNRKRKSLKKHPPPRQTLPLCMYECANHICEWHAETRVCVARAGARGLGA